jgi:ubiquinone/menaquinone biosynthesis C-methylase UbiE
MNRVKQHNINTPCYWNAVYTQERAERRQRVDARRLEEVLRWVQVRHEELQRHVDVLDIGCGLGDLTEFLGSRMPDTPVAGVDISSDCIEHCSRKGRPRAPLRVGSAEALPFNDESFDLVWCGETLEHLEDPERAILEMRRVTREHGFILISTPYRGRNTSEEHVWEYEPGDIARWAAMCGELVFLDCHLLTSWLTMFAAFRRAVRTEPS